MSKSHHFLKNQDGATAIEYALIAAGIAVIIIAVVFSLGQQLETTFGTVYDGLDSRQEAGQGGGSSGPGKSDWGKSQKWHNK